MSHKTRQELNEELLRMMTVHRDLPLAERMTRMSTALAAGAAVDVPGAMGRTALWYAARQDSLDIVLLLLRHKADPDKTDDDGKGPLHEAIDGCYFAVADALLQNGANIDCQGGYRRQSTPLHCAILFDAMRGEDCQRVEYVAARGASLTARDNCGMTPAAYAYSLALHWPLAAAIGRYLDAILQRQADAELQDKRDALARQNRQMHDGFNTPIGLAARPPRLKRKGFGA